MQNAKQNNEKEEIWFKDKILTWRKILSYNNFICIDQHQNNIVGLTRTTTAG